jgi:hypothetical protein
LPTILVAKTFRSSASAKPPPKPPPPPPAPVSGWECFFLIWLPKRPNVDAKTIFPSSNSQNYRSEINKVSSQICTLAITYFGTLLEAFIIGTLSSFKIG